MRCGELFRLGSHVKLMEERLSGKADDEDDEVEELGEGPVQVETSVTKEGKDSSRV